MIVAVRRLVLAALVLLAPALAAAQTYTISPPPFLLAQNNSGAIINNACIWTYTAGTTTPATTYTTSTGTANTNPIRSDSAGRFTAFLAPGSSYKFVYESACVPPAHGTVLRTADNISAIPASAASVDDTGIAGESITAGQCVYLSNGDGSKTTGQWYKCDSANGYSAYAKAVGIATVNITSAGSGTVRVAGLVTGLTSLSVGADYYVGSAGALTLTAPVNVRRVGQAESATTLLLAANPPPIAVGGTTPFFGFVDDFRLSLTTATCGTTSDVTAATTLYLTPCHGNRLTLFDSNNNPETCTSAEISIAIPATTSQMYDVWVYDSGSCTPTLELLAWTNDTTRATALVRTNGRWTKTGATTRLYVGSVRTTTVSGQTEDSLTKRFVWNYYNRLPRALAVKPTGNYTYTLAAWRQANGSTANQVAFVIGVADTPVRAQLVATLAQGTATSARYGVALGLDSTTVASGLYGRVSVLTAGAGVEFGIATATYEEYPAIGQHFLAMLEYGDGTTAMTVYGTGATASGSQSGIEGVIQG